MNKSQIEWDKSAERFDQFKKTDLAWKYILFPAINSLDIIKENKTVIDV